MYLAFLGSMQHVVHLSLLATFPIFVLGACGGSIAAIGDDDASTMADVASGGNDGGENRSDVSHRDAVRDVATDPLNDGGRDAADQLFTCGKFLCHSATQYCKVGVGGAFNSPTSYQCEPIPAACTDDHGCTCIRPAVGGQLCADDGGEVTVTFEYP